MRLTITATLGATLTSVFLATAALAFDFDRTDPQATASAALTALQTRDLETLAALANETNASFFAEIAEEGESHRNYNAVFTGWSAEQFDAWDGTLGETRYRIIGDNVFAIVPFGDPVDGEVPVLSLEEDANGFWGIEDINSPSPESLAELPTTR